MDIRKGFRFTTYEAPEQTSFDKLFDIFQELITLPLALVCEGAGPDDSIRPDYRRPALPAGFLNDLV